MPAFQFLTLYEFAAIGQLVAVSRQHPVVLALLLQLCLALPAQRDVIHRLVDGALQNGAVGSLADQLCLVLVVCQPVAGVVGMGAGRVGEA